MIPCFYDLIFDVIESGKQLIASLNLKKLNSVMYDVDKHRIDRLRQKYDFLLTKKNLSLSSFFWNDSGFCTIVCKYSEQLGK